ncbi:hypothetical protein ACFL2V_07140 [Pseudomonadota bacterium]
MTNISYSKNSVTIAGVTITLEHVVLIAFELKGKVIVLFDPDEYIPKFGQFNNFIALDLEGAKMWEAELPTTETGDCYFKVSSREPLIVNSYKSYVCEIDSDTGKIISKNFTK